MLAEGHRLIVSASLKCFCHGRLWMSGSAHELALFLCLQPRHPAALLPWARWPQAPLRLQPPAHLAPRPYPLPPPFLPCPPQPLPLPQSRLLPLLVAVAPPAVVLLAAVVLPAAAQVVQAAEAAE